MATISEVKAAVKTAFLTDFDSRAQEFGFPTGVISEDAILVGFQSWEAQRAGRLGVTEPYGYGMFSLAIYADATEQGYEDLDDLLSYMGNWIEARQFAGYLEPAQLVRVEPAAVDEDNVATVSYRATFRVGFYLTPPNIGIHPPRPFYDLPGLANISGIWVGLSYHPNPRIQREQVYP